MLQPSRLPPHSIRHWLQQGWHNFVATKWISLGFSAIFVVIGLSLAWVLFSRGLWVLLFPFISGFLLVTPILITGYQRAARLLSQGERPRFRDLVLGITEGTPGIWFISFILCFCYLIWVTDALVFYSLYVGLESVTSLQGLVSDPEAFSQLLAYLFFSGLMGLVIATIVFSVAAFSIPLIIHRRMPFVAAVHTSVVTVWRHPWLMLRWGATIAGLSFVTMILALPLLVFVLPLLGYATYAAFVALFPEE